jgi:serine protease Do
VNGVEKIRVSFVDTEDMPATIVDFDKDLDLALLKVDVTRSVASPPGAILSMQVGDDVFAVGSPRKMNFTVSRGMVSFIGRRIDGRYYLQSDLPTNDGNSGGPVVNDRGEVVGVMTFILRDSQGLAFAVPIEYAYERFADHLKSDRVDLSRFQRWREEKESATASR